jgi:hypothetical protein
MFYKSISDNDVSDLTIIKNFNPITERVYAVLGRQADYGWIPSIDEEYFFGLLANMERANCWSTIHDWNTVVTYSIVTANNTVIFVEDSNHGETTECYTEQISEKYEGVADGKTVRLMKIAKKPYNYKLIKTRRYRDVTIESRKVFEYTSKNSKFNWVFTSLWKGTTKEQAEHSARFCSITIELKTESAPENETHLLYSFIEKVLDALSRPAYIEFKRLQCI